MSRFQVCGMLLALAIFPLLYVDSKSAAFADMSSISTDTTWRAIGPVGNLEGQPINNVGLVWESEHAGWNTDMNYDDSDAAGWTNAIRNGQKDDAIWVNGDGINGSTPAYFRKKFYLSALPPLALLDIEADDDVQFYINGVLVYDDHDGTANGKLDIDVTAYLSQGGNLIAMKAHDSAGSNEWIRAHLNIIIRVSTDTTWRAIGPVGNLEGQSINNVGLVWESEHAGWNTDMNYDDSDAAGWTNAIRSVQKDDAIWVNGDGVNGSTPAYFRKKFYLSAFPTLALLDIGADDDVQFYLNGVLVYDDHDGTANEKLDIDVTAYLRQGENLIAMKTHDSAGGYEFVWANLDVPILESPALVSAVSRKWHQAAGAFDINIPIGSAQLVTECRSGNPFTIVLTFTKEIHAADGVLDNEVSVSCGLLPVLTLNGKELMVEILDVPSPSCLTLTMSGLVDDANQPLEDTTQVNLGILTGDVNGDGKVNVLDLLMCRNNTNKPVTMTNFRADVIPDGKINVLDLLEIKKNMNKTVVPSGMVFVPPGIYQMGDPFNEGEENERPSHAVYTDAFYMDRYEVTNQQYADALNWANGEGNLITVSNGRVYKYNSGTSYPYCETITSSPYSHITWNGSSFGVTAGKENHPMLLVTWYGSAAYCNWRSAMQGKPLCYDLATWECNYSANGYRLPTEAEWEKAARGGLQGKRYPWGDDIDGSKANYWQSGDPFETGNYPWTTPVGYYNSSQIPAGVDMSNGYGLYDMAGNVWEWCNDWLDGSYYNTTPYPHMNPRGPTSGSYRVFRGGGWAINVGNERVSYRGNGTPDGRNFDLGFRCALVTCPF